MDSQVNLGDSGIYSTSLTRKVEGIFFGFAGGMPTTV
jgi:hypothetical protein